MGKQTESRPAEGSHLARGRAHSTPRALDGTHARSFETGAMAKEEEDRDPQYEEGDPSGSGGGSGGSGGEGGGSGGDKEVRQTRLARTPRIRARTRLTRRKRTRKTPLGVANPSHHPSHDSPLPSQASDGDDSNGMDQERENSATRYSGSHREGHDDHGRGSRGASPDEIGQDARSTKKDPSEGDDEELGVDEEMVDVDGVDGSDEGSDAMHKETPMNRGAQPANAPPRFDFHDFPRKTNQADVANAAVTAEVRAGRRFAHARWRRTAGVDHKTSSNRLTPSGSARTTQTTGPRRGARDGRG